MKDRILFWVDIGLEHFGIAKFMQKNYECDLYVIYELKPKSKKYFSNQKIVDFKKEWYFYDHVHDFSKKPDIDYLQKFEEKYKINLWNIIYNERLFYKFNNFYKFKRNELLSIMEKQCKFFEKILAEVKPDFLAIKLTDYNRTELLTAMCRSNNIKVLMQIPTKVGIQSAISTDFQHIDNPIRLKEPPIDRTFSEIQEHVKRKYNIDINNIVTKGPSLPINKKIKTALKWISSSRTPEFKRVYDNFGVTSSKVIINEILFQLKRKYRKSFIDKNLILDINRDEKFVYFPLHIEPERTISTDAPFYTNQIEVVKYISKSLPIEYKLYVKEHYMQSDRVRNWRKTSFYKEILDIPNVRLIHPTIKPEELIKKSDLVITISGTAGLEAAMYEKPAITFTDVLYSSLPSVYRLKSLQELPRMIRTSIGKKVKRDDLNKFLNYIDKNSYEHDTDSFHTKILDRFHNSNFVMNDKISMKDLEQFLNENQQELEKVALEYIKKIKNYKIKN